MGILGLVLQQLPTLVDLIKSRHAAVNPSAAPLTDAEVLAALQQAIASSIAKDDQWLAAHGKKP